MLGYSRLSLLNIRGAPLGKVSREHHFTQLAGMTGSRSPNVTFPCLEKDAASQCLTLASQADQRLDSKVCYDTASFPPRPEGDNKVHVPSILLTGVQTINYHQAITTEGHRWTPCSDFVNEHGLCGAVKQESFLPYLRSNPPIITHDSFSEWVGGQGGWLQRTT